MYFLLLPSYCGSHKASTSFNIDALPELTMWCISLACSSQYDSHSLIHNFPCSSLTSKFICAGSLLYIYIVLAMERHNYPPKLGVPIITGVAPFFGFSIPFILLKIIENSKELWFKWVIVMKI